MILIPLLSCQSLTLRPHQALCHFPAWPHTLYLSFFAHSIPDTYNILTLKKKKKERTFTLYCSIADSQCCNSFRCCHQSDPAIYVCVYIYTHIYVFSPKVPSHPVCHIMLSRVLSAIQ